MPGVDSPGLDWPGRKKGPLRVFWGVAVCERGGTVVAAGELPDVVPAAGLLSAALEAGVLPDDWRGTRCAGSVVVGMLPLAGWRGVVVLCPSALSAQKTQIILRKVRTATDHKIKYLFFSLSKKLHLP
ncbi:MAG: hypothetical protein JWP57_145 [Spirosoma sp.]|nr:hypothetical protein [Spirosoma sp.]